MLLDRLAPGLTADAVLSDNVGGAYAGVDHLAQAGHRRIGVIAGRRAVSAIQERLAGYERALRAHGITLDPDLNVWGGHSVPGGHEACLKLLKLEKPPTAIFGTNNLVLRGALLALHDAGLASPEDVSLLGFDDFDEAVLFSPPVSVVAQQPFAMGWQAGQLLLERLTGRSGHASPRRIRLDTRLIRRGSVAAPRAFSKEVVLGTTRL